MRQLAETAGADARACVTAGVDSLTGTWRHRAMCKNRERLESELGKPSAT